MSANRRLFRYSTAVVFALGGVTLAALAGYAHTYSQSDRVAILLFGIALLFWLLAISLRPGDIRTQLNDSDDRSSTPARRLPLPFVFGAFALALITFFNSTDNTFTLDNVASWFLSIAVFVYAFWQPERSWEDWRVYLKDKREHVLRIISEGLHVPSRVVLFAFILLVGWFFYFYNLDGVPGEMDSDHAEKVLDVNDVVTKGLRPIFFERNTGREPLEFYLISALVAAEDHPIDHMALKLVTATMGLLVIPGTFLMVRELLDEQVAFAASALVAISKWPVAIARMGLRFPFTPVFIAPLVYFFLRALKYRRRNDFLMTGLFLGMGLYGYNAFRIAPVLLLAFVGLWAIKERLSLPYLARLVGSGAMAAVFALLVFMPLFRYSLDHPESFWYRVLTRLSAEEQSLPGNPVRIFADNSVNAALMFNWAGDEAWPNSIPGDPALDVVSGGLFLLGLVYSVYRIVRYREWAYVFLLIGLAILLLPTALSIAFPNENPSNARAGGAVPFVFTVIALPVVWLARALKENARFLPRLIVPALFLLIAGLNFVRYFVDFDKSYRELSWNSDEVANVIRSYATSVGDYAHAYIFLYPHWVDTRNVAINMGQIGWDQTISDQSLIRTQARDASNKLYILNENDKIGLQALQDTFPNGQKRLFQSAIPGHNFIIWYVPGSISPDLPLGVDRPVEP